ncbi:ankyrin repeat domain-containing protein [Lysobacter sp. BMK333-48F3]|uniref:ankyrin repeat domain-containing protein n=1 Tax=Lysobacter sp. BMK333-48F3 TaxID=2867962 RepID=UPI001C8C0145|nr:ankyrin repeat domain-containing protein [Lysobacter sp. BMK333-48F3]MBX9400896.1 ankyrin repeat domain-containing protein [Lysobacter sp. BMK333-48F3]
MKLKATLLTLIATIPLAPSFADASQSAQRQAVPAGQESARAGLFDAARAGDLERLRSALAEGASTSARDDRGNTPLILAAYYGNAQAVEALLAAGADPNVGDGARGNTALMGAIFKGDEDIARRLIAEPGTDVNAKNKAGQTAAMFAALFGRAAIIDALAARGADLQAADASGNSAETLARQQGNDELAERISRLAHAGEPR